MSINGKSPYYDGGTFRLYLFDYYVKTDVEQHWVGYLSLKVGNHWVSAGGATSNSQENALKALLRIHCDYYQCMTQKTPPYSEVTIDTFVKDLVDAKEKQKATG